MKKIKLFKKRLLLGMLMVSSISFPIILSSCSSTSTAIDKLVSKGDGLKLSEQTSLSDFAKSALLSDAGMKKYADQIVGQSLFNLMTKLGSNDSPSKKKALYKQKFDENEETIKESFESTQESSKSTNGSDFPIKFQQEELDPHGGSEESWKKEKQLEWAITEFKNMAFENLYVSLVDSSGNHVLVTQENLNKVFNNGSEVKIAFTPNYNLDSSKPNFDSFVVSEIAKFQEFVFNQWVKSENPFIVNFATWSYGSITGNSNNYKTTATGHANNFTNPFQSTYSFPYFDDTKSNETESVVQKFINFTNLTTTDVPNNSAGLKMNLTKYSTSTESYKLVSGRNEHSISDPSEAIASLYMFDNLVGSQASGGAGGSTIATGTSNNLKKPLTTTASNGLDVITSNFVVDDVSKLQANGGTAGSGKAGSSIPYIEIAPSLVDRIFINPPKNGTPNGTKSLYAIDAFIPSNVNGAQPATSPLSDYIFFRNKSGVTALSIDGGKYIGKATTYDEAKQKAGEIILYRYLESSLSGSNKDNTYAVDVRAKLNQFLTENFNTLIFQYWKNNSSNQIIDFSWLSNEQKNVMDALTKYLYIYVRRNDVSSYQNALLNEKTAFSTNYGDKFAEKNGLASPYPYNFVDAKQSSTTTPPAQSKNTSSVNYGHYSLIDSIVVSKNPFDSSSNSSTTNVANYWTDPYVNNGVYSEYVSAVEKLVANVKPLESKSSTFKYSQYIFVDDFYINQALIAYGADAEILGNNEKVKIAEKYFSDNNIGINNFDGKEFKANNYQVSKFMINSIDSKDDINSALSNYMFGSTFDSSTNKWLFLESSFAGSFQKPASTDGSSSGAMQATQSTIPTITYSDLDTYRLNYWLRDKQAISSVNLNEYLTFLKTIIAIDYLLKDNGSRFMNELINKTPSDKPSYLVWEVGYDSSVNSNVNITTQKDLLYGTSGDSAYSNVNNAQGNAYYPNKNFSNTYVENNSIDSIFITTGNYYKHVSQMTGFQNIVSSDNSSAISKPLANMIFDDPTYNGNKLGLLYTYASSRTEFINLINGYSFSNQLNDLAKTMEKLFPELVPQLKEVQNAEETSKKKELLVAIVNSTNGDSSGEGGQGTNNYKIPDDAFKPRNGYIKTSTTDSTTNGLYQDEIDKHSQIKYGSYLIQLNQGNLKDLSTFITYLSSSFTSNMPSNGTANNQQTNTANQLAYNLIANLLVSVATSTSIQDEAFNKIAEDYKIDIYDWRLNLQLGEVWAKNYKDQDN